MGPTTLLGPPEDWEGTERNCTESGAGPKSSIAPRWPEPPADGWECAETYADACWDIRA